MTTTRCLINSLITMLFCIYGGAGISGLKASIIFSGTVERDTTVYLVADEAPRFEGELETWLGENIRYRTGDHGIRDRAGREYFGGQGVTRCPSLFGHGGNTGYRGNAEMEPGKDWR